MSAFEKLGMFYLGRPVDPDSGETVDSPLLLDARDLTTHAVCVGMTGSGKTGLCIDLLEEAALDGIPSLVIDPKGDMGNLLLTFPELDGPSFRPWVDGDAARRADLSVDEFANAQAALWKKGLAGWGQDGDRIRALRASADFKIYTPGSDAGEPISILSSFAAPSEEVRADDDLFRERVSTTAASLLGLIGIDADPLRSREHILISNVLEQL
ncbi:MAG: type IV secretory system conjugative DNA transfer family protein, partial [Acidobacteriota bacterium]|nr:type IV secretory system conjugative DNA transfer family protein [Acidobacteriota bacterium]